MTTAGTPAAAPTQPAPKPKRKVQSKPAPKRKGRFADTDKITVLENKRRPGSSRYKLFAKLRTGMTVASAVAAGISRSMLAKDVKRGALKIR